MSAPRPAAPQEQKKGEVNELRTVRCIGPTSLAAALARSGDAESTTAERPNRNQTNQLR